MKNVNGESKIGYRKVLMTQKEYCKLIIANLINRFGDSIDSIAFAWLVYAITNSATWSAIIFGLNRIPTIFLQPFAGAMVENRNKKSIMIVTNCIRGLCVGFIAYAYFVEILQPWMLVITTLIISSVEAFCSPASMSVIPNILEKEYYSFGISLNSSASSVVELIGFGVAGFIIATFGIATAIAIDAATFGGAALIILFINTHETKKQKQKINMKGYIKLLTDGVGYLKNKKIVLHFIILAVLANAVFVPFNCLQAALVKEVLHSGEQMMSVLSIAVTVGMMIATFTFPYLAMKFSIRFFVGVGGVSFGLYYILLVACGKYISSSLWLYILVGLLSFVAGFLISLLISSLNVQFLKTVEKEYLARAGAIMSAVSVSAIPIVSLLISGLVSIVSVKFLFIVAGVLEIAIFVFFMLIKMQFEEKDAI